MKPLFVIICLAASITFFVQCSKNNDGGSLFYSSKSINGTWELAKAGSGMVPVTNFPAGNGNLLKFTDSSYQIFNNGQLEKSGTYLVVSDTTVEANVCLVVEKDEYRRRIIYDNDTTAAKIFFDLDENKLHVLSGCFAVDGGSYYQYIRTEGVTDK